MVLLGDILAILAVIAGVCLSSWAILMAFAALFPRRTEFARQALENKPWKQTTFGLITWLAIGGTGIALLASPVGLLKLLGTFLLIIISAITAVGCAGLAQIVAHRFMKMDSNLSEYSALTRSVNSVVVAGLFPLVGWFVVVPLVLGAGLGAGSSALRRKPELDSTPSHLEFSV